jgi:hypothetical protein
MPIPQDKPKPVRHKAAARDARKKAKQAKNAAAASPTRDWQLPAHWPPFTTPEHYAWNMARMPAGALPADWSKHQPHNSYSPLFWYQDQARVCTQCGGSFVFTKEQQQKWYEEYHIPIYAYGSRCAPCRRALREVKAAQKRHMEAMARREPHPNEAFFRTRALKKT